MFRYNVDYVQLNCNCTIVEMDMLYFISCLCKLDELRRDEIPQENSIPGLNFTRTKFLLNFGIVFLADIKLLQVPRGS